MLSWTAVVAATSYKVKRATSAGGPYSNVQTATTTTFTDTNLTNGTKYFYVVSATNAIGESGNSNETAATPKGSNWAPPSLAAMWYDPAAELHWTDNNGNAENAPYYIVKKATMAGGPYTTCAIIDARSMIYPTCTDFDVTPGTTYYYVVSADSGTDESPNSNEVSITPGYYPRNVSTYPAIRGGQIVPLFDRLNEETYVDTAVVAAGRTVSFVSSGTDGAVDEDRGDIYYLDSEDYNLVFQWSLDDGAGNVIPLATSPNTYPYRGVTFTMPSGSGNYILKCKIDDSLPDGQNPPATGVTAPQTGSRNDVPIYRKIRLVVPEVSVTDVTAQGATEVEKKEPALNEWYFVAAEGAADEQVTLTATLAVDTPQKRALIDWEGAVEDPNNPLVARVPKDAAAQHGVRIKNGAEVLAEVPLDVIRVKFVEDGAAQKYGFDNYTYSINPWKSVEVGETDTAFAQITPPLAANTVHFMSSDDLTMTVSPEQAEIAPQEVTVTGLLESHPALMGAEVDANAGTFRNPTLGKMRVAIYPWKVRRVSIILVNEENDDVQAVPFGAQGQPNQVCVSKGNNNFRDSVPDPNDGLDADDNIIMGPDGVCNTRANNANVMSRDVDHAAVEAQLKKVYKQAVFALEVQYFSKTVNFDLNRNGTLDINFPSTGWSVEEKAIINSCQDDQDHNMFVVQASRYLPINGIASAVGGKWAFTYTFPSAPNGVDDRYLGVTRTLSHELGHCLKLYDDRTPDTENIMCQTNWAQPEAVSWRLRKDQWDAIQAAPPPIQVNPQ